ncbi:thioredoxin family protein [Rossellomorea aquimaris]|uniref:thioredoxin family protein n=1 Tax=Rossellomorea aquimaris TaxID=189382 RepID=UPI001CD214B9|nr:thioredoxin family protein [Rossellomorea aquimaris]MCA1060835.1 thioredoxin family protein [Rossellomorea aquimaris]
MKKKIVISLLAALSIGIIFLIVDSSTLDKPMYTNINLEEYKNKLNNEENFLIYVYKTSCPVCQETKPLLNEVIEKEKVTILAMNSEEEGNLEKSFFEKQKLEKSPTIIFYNNGIEEDRIEGYHSQKEISSFVTKYKSKAEGES